MPSVDLICLANSFKENQRCIAGIRVDGGGWIRPVSEREHGELEYNHRRLPDHSEPQTLDVIRVGLSNPRPLPHQPENWSLDGSAWELIARPASAEYAPVLAAAVSHNPALFGTTGSSVPEEQFQRHAAMESLVVVQPSDTSWRTVFNTYKQRKKARVMFRLDRIWYDLPLTDPSYNGSVKALETGDHRSSEIGISQNSKILLTISLSEPLDGICYKLAAAVVVVPPAWNRFL